MVVKDLVLIGGGHSHVVVLKSFAMKPMPGVRLTLVTWDVHTPYSGMLPGFVAGHYTYDDCHIDLRPLAQLSNARLLHCCASGIDLEQRAVVLADGRPPIRYDVLSIDIGITPLVCRHLTCWRHTTASAALLRHSGMDLEQRAVVLADGSPPLRYDVLSIDIGISPLRAVVLADGRPPIRYDVLSIGIGITTLVTTLNSLVGSSQCRTAVTQVWTSITVLHHGTRPTRISFSTPCEQQSVPGAKELTLPGKPIDSFTHRWVVCGVGGVKGYSGVKGLECALCLPLSGPLPSSPSSTLSEQQSVPGAKELTLPVKPIDSFTHRWEALRSRILSLAAVSSSMRRRGVESGGGRGDREGAVDGAEGEVGRGSGSGAGGGEGRESAQDGSAVQGGVLVLEGGEEVEFDECVWCTQGGAASWLAQTGLALDNNGFIRVGETLESISHKGVFAAGDIHSSDVYPRPKAGVFAVRQGMPLAKNLRRALLDQPLKPFRPQKTFLSLISTGDQYAVFSRGSLAFEDRLMWTLKDRIDRAFMRQFSQLPAMPSPPLPTIPIAHTAGPEALLALKSMPMRCGGCGSKVGSSLLSRVLTRLSALPSRPPGRPEILLGLDSPDDAAVLAIPHDSTGGRQSPVVVQTVDFFRSFLSDPHTFGRIAALHALSDCFAMGADPVSALAIVTLPYGTEEKMEEDLFQLMAGAIRELDAATCQLVGGHTVEGAELSLGFAVTGLADRDRLLRKAGMCAGDAIILTKPIGTGVIFAANMRCKAKGRWVDGAIDSMLVSNQKAAAIALQHGASAATDVTGFGLLGHLVEMTTASRVKVTVDPSTVPILDGALECVEEGIFSSLQDSNLHLRRAITNYEEASAHPLTPLLFDPQTAGGLLLSVPQATATQCLLALHREGYPAAAAIGGVVSSSAGEASENASVTIEYMQ
ncbi:unnamed protein product [Closterium sp. Yama58-4]|nr:unnamed protein product [Closterium sp. Yama58-4]